MKPDPVNISMVKGSSLGTCMECGTGGLGSGILCDRCRSSKGWDALEGTTAWYLVPLVIYILVLLWSLSRSGSGLPFEEMFDIHFGIIGACIISVLVWTILESVRNRDLFRSHLRNVPGSYHSGPIFLSMVIPVILSVEGPIGFVAFTGTAVLAATAMAIGFRRDKRISFHFIMIVLSCLIYGAGTSILIEDIGSQVPFFLTPGPLISLSLLALALFVFLEGRYRSIGERAVTSSVLFLMGYILLFVPVSLDIIGSSIGGLAFNLMMFTSILFVISGISMNLCREYSSMVMRWSEKEGRRAIGEARAHLEQGNAHYALIQYDRALAENPIHGLGREMGRRGPLSKTLGPSRMGLEHRPDEYSITYNEMGRIRASEGRTKAAVGEFQKAIGTDPLFIDPYMNMIMVQASIAGKSKEARRYRDYLIGLKVIYLKRAFEQGLTKSQMDWLLSSFDRYVSDINEKMEAIVLLSRKEDIWRYHRLARET